MVRRTLTDPRDGAIYTLGRMVACRVATKYEARGRTWARGIGWRRLDCGAGGVLELRIERIELCRWK